jgi:hypothetical protein
MQVDDQAMMAWRNNAPFKCKIFVWFCAHAFLACVNQAMTVWRNQNHFKSLYADHDFPQMIGA